MRLLSPRINPFPVVATFGNLAFTDSDVWAVYRIAGEPTAFMSDPKLVTLHSQLKLTVAQQTGEAMLASVCRIVTPQEVYEQSRVDSSSANDFRSAALADDCEHRRQLMFERRQYLFVRVLERERTAFEAALLSFGGSKPSLPTHQEVEKARIEANSSERQMSSGIGLERASVAEVSWLQSRKALRGDGDSWEATKARVSETANRGVRRVMPDDYAFVNGGSRDDEGRQNDAYLKILSGTSTGPTFHKLGVVSATPDEFIFPGPQSGLCASLEQLDFLPLDYFVRFSVTAPDKARRKASMRRQNLDAQDLEYNQVPQDLMRAQEQMNDLVGLTELDRTLSLLETTIIFHLAGPGLSDLEDDAKTLASIFEASGYRLSFPIGGQLDLFRSSSLGGPSTLTDRHYSQIFTPPDLAGWLPAVNSEVVGTDGGNLIGQVGAEPVYFSPWMLTKREGANVLHLGGMGGGKSNALFADSNAVIFSGGKVIAIDQTGGDGVKGAETVHAEALSRFGFDCRVVDLDGSEPVSLDPMRIYGRESADLGKELAASFFQVILGLSTNEPMSIAITRAIESVYDSGREPSMAAVVDYLRQGDDVARDVAVLIDGSYAKTHLGRMVFEPTHRPVSLDGDYVVFNLPGVDLPGEEQFASSEAAKTILPAQRLGQGLLFLIAGISRKEMFADKNRFVVLRIDEASFFAQNPTASALVKNTERSGRRLNAAVFLASQLSRDIPASWKELIKVYFIYKVDSKADARACLTQIGLEPRDEWVDLVMRLRPGQCLMRDQKHRVQLLQRNLEPIVELAAAAASGRDEVQDQLTAARRTLAAHV